MIALLPADSKSTSVDSQNSQLFRKNSHFPKCLIRVGEQIMSLKYQGKAYQHVGLVIRTKKMYNLPHVRSLVTELLSKM